MGKPKQFFTAELHGSGAYSYSYGYEGRETLPDDPPKELHGRYHKIGVRGSWRREVVREVDLDGSVEDVIKTLQEGREGLDGPYLSIEMESVPYSDSEYPRAKITGSREATPEEVQWIARQQERDAEATEQARLQEIDRLRQQLTRLGVNPYDK